MGREEIERGKLSLGLFLSHRYLIIYIIKRFPIIIALTWGAVLRLIVLLLGRGATTPSSPPHLYFVCDLERPGEGHGTLRGAVGGGGVSYHIFTVGTRGVAGG